MFEFALLEPIGGQVKVYEKLDCKKDKVTFLEQYKRSHRTGRLLGFGVRLSERDMRSVKDFKLYINNGKSYPLKYDETLGYFYQSDIFSQEGLGVSKAGFFKITAENVKDGSKCESEKILIKPAVITEKDFNNMVNLLLNIHNDLAVDDSSNTLFEAKSNIIDEVLKILISVEEALNRINKSPEVSLISKESKVAYEKIKKFSSKLILEKATYPYKNKFSSEVKIETRDIYENRIIYKSLKDIEGFLKVKLSHSKEHEVKLKKDISDTESAMLALKENTKHIYWKELKLKLPTLKRNSEVIKDRIKKIDSGLKRVKEYTELEVFDDIRGSRETRDILRPTQIFMHNTSYGLLYRRIKEFYKASNYNVEGMGLKDLNIKPLYNIFETWCFFYMIKILVQKQGWELKGKTSFIESCNKYIDKNGSLDGFKANLTHKLKGGSEVYLDLIFNRRLPRRIGSLKPDFTMELDCKGEKKTIYLDAKYHNYKEELSQFQRDIKEVADEKYFKRTEGTGHEAVASYIVHCNDEKRFTSWGEKKDQHKLGSFPLLPDRYGRFLTWTSMIMEWIYDEYSTCWNCGSTGVDCKEEKTIGGNPKYHFKCRACGSFWVKSHCYNMKKSICGNRKLVKHDLLEKQYHESKKDGIWMVACPRCGG